MGMYTDFHLSVDLDYSTPRLVTDILDYMVDYNNDVRDEPMLPVHPLFKTFRWRFMLADDFYYRKGCSVCRLYHGDWSMASYKLTVYTSLKNYDHEIEKFLDWIEPYIISEGFIGYMVYEECDDLTLIYCVDGKIEYRKQTS